MSAKPIILVTGFEPFDGDAINPSQDIVRRLHGRVIAGRPIVGGVLPCVFGSARRQLARLLKEARPELVICLGLAGGRDGLSLERVALNVDDARIPDNAGFLPVDQPIVRGGPVAYWTGLPIKAIVDALRARGLPAHVSQTAGTFVCNHVFYALMHRLRRLKGVRGGFIHVPWLPAQAPPGQPCLPLETMVEGIEIAVRVSLSSRRRRKPAH